MEIIERINDERKKAGLGQLIHSAHLTRISFFRAREMVRQEVPLAHIKSSYDPNASLEDVVSNRKTGEVIFANMSGRTFVFSLNSKKDFNRVVDGWMNSDSHKAVLLHGIFRYLGVAQDMKARNVVVVGTLSDQP